MLAAYLTGALICVTALVAGRVARIVLGFGPVALVPGVGLAIVVIVANLCEKLPGGATAAGLGLGVLLIGAIAFVAIHDSGREREPNPEARASHRLVPFSMLLAVLAISIPFFVNGRIGPLGAGLVNDDMASHLLFTDWLITHAGAVPDQVGGGYPLGPHSLVAGISRLTGAAPVEVFAGLTFAIAALTAATAFAALEGVRPLFRVAAAALVALSYLGAAWLAQGAFKEPMLALFLLAFALGLRDLDGLRPAIALGLVAAGTLYTYSFPGLAWLAAAALAWALLERAWLWRAAAVTAGVVVFAAIPELGRLIDFTGYNAFDPENVGDRVGLGNLVHPLNPLEAFGIWPAADFRASAASASVIAPLLYVGALLAVAAVAYGVLAAWGRRDAPLLAGFAGASGMYLVAVVAGTPYTSAKALAIAAPVLMLVALKGLLGTERTADGDRRARGAPLEGDSGFLVQFSPESGAPAIAVIALTLAFMIGAAISSFLPLRAGAVGPSDHADEIRSFRDEIDGRRVLFLGREQYVADELIGSKVATPILNYYNQKSLGNRFPPQGGETVKLDFDAVTPELLDFYAFAITTSAGFQSGAPPNFEPVARTGDYVLWRRTGPTPPRTSLPEPNGPGALFACSTPAGRKAVAAAGTATVFAKPPVVGAADGWTPSSRVTDSSRASQALTLPPGRWRISLQYVATQDAHLRAPGLDSTLPANLDFRGPSPFWSAGEIDVPKSGPVRFTLSVDPPTRFGRLIGAESLAFPLAIAATPAETERTVPVAKACGLYVDFLSPAS